MQLIQLYQPNPTFNLSHEWWFTNPFTGGDVTYNTRTTHWVEYGKVAAIDVPRWVKEGALIIIETNTHC